MGTRIESVDQALERTTSRAHDNIGCRFGRRMIMLGKWRKSARPSCKVKALGLLGHGCAGMPSGRGRGRLDAAISLTRE